MNVDRMVPAMGVVSQYPPFRSVSLTREADLDAVAGREGAVRILSVDLPLAIPPLEFRRASNSRWHIDWRQSVELPPRGVGYPPVPRLRAHTQRRLHATP